MAKMKDLKRENFDVSPEQQASIEMLQHVIDAPTKKDALLMAVRTTLLLAAELKKGNQLFVGHPGEDLRRFVMLGIERPDLKPLLYLVPHEHPWKRQLYVKGRKLPAAAVWSAIKTNNLSLEQAMDNWDLPAAAVNEIIEYCESNQDLLRMEAQEELRRLREKGIEVDTVTPCR
jgi:hypothetical protein